MKIEKTKEVLTHLLKKVCVSFYEDGDHLYRLNEYEDISVIVTKYPKEKAIEFQTTDMETMFEICEILEGEAVEQIFIPITKNYFIYIVRVEIN